MNKNTYQMTELYENVSSRRLDFVLKMQALAGHWKDVLSQTEGSLEWEEQSTLALNLSRDLTIFLGINRVIDEVVGTVKVIVFAEGKNSLSKAKCLALKKAFTSLSFSPNLSEQEWDQVVFDLDDAGFDINI